MPYVFTQELLLTGRLLTTIAHIVHCSGVSDRHVTCLFSVFEKDKATIAQWV